MTMLEKIEAVRKVQGYTVDIKEKLKEVIKDTYDYHCTDIEDFTVGRKAIDVTYHYVCRGYGDVDYADIPLEWLAEGFDYKTAFLELRKKKEEEQKQIALKEKQKAEAKKAREEKKLYLKLKAKYEKEEVK